MGIGNVNDDERVLLTNELIIIQSDKERITYHETLVGILAAKISNNTV